jgi:hypothetical protein
MRDYTYEHLVDLDDDVLLIEWDLAVSREDFATFRARAAGARGDVLVAPYRLYATTERTEEYAAPPWALQRYVNDEQNMRFCTPNDTHAHLFGFGLVYLPRDLIRAFVATGHRFGDGEFSGWHYRNVRPEVPIAWDVRPIHLHPLT